MSPLRPVHRDPDMTAWWQNNHASDVAECAIFVMESVPEPSARRARAERKHHQIIIHRHDILADNTDNGPGGSVFVFVALAKWFIV